MAVDTAARRFSMMDFDLPTQPGMVPPTGTVDRITMLWLYVGISLSAVADIWTTVSPASGSWSTASPASGTWTPVTPASGSWTDV